MRLRPSGRAGTVATHIAGFERYQKEDAWVWEHLALSRARVIAGDEALASQIEDVRQDVLGAQHDASVVSKGLAEMRARISTLAEESENSLNVKKQLGGMLDIELIAQALCLISANFRRKPSAQIEAALKAGLINQQDGAKLLDAHQFFSIIVHLRGLIGNQHFDLEKLTPMAKTFLLSSLGIESNSLLKSRIKATRKTVKSIIDKLVETTGQPSK